MNRLFATLAVAFLGFLASVNAYATDPQSEAVLRNLREKYPQTTFTAVRPSPVPGLYEVQMGRNLAYTDDIGKMFFFGAIFDMEARADLTAVRRSELGIPAPEAKQAAAAAQPARAEAPPVDWSKLPLADAFARVKGNGKRKVAVFSDPDCPFCKRLEPELEKLTDVTIYTFMFPLASLHPDAASKSEAVWCAGTAATRSALWLDLLTKGKLPKGAKECESPLERNLALADSLNIRGTPTLIAADGRRLSGAGSAERIDAFLNGSTK